MTYDSISDHRRARIFDSHGDSHARRNPVFRSRNTLEVVDKARPTTRPWAWWQFEAPKAPRIVARRCVDPECRVRDNSRQHEPHDVLEDDARYLDRIGELTPLERGYFEAQRRDEAERAESFQRACEAYDASKRARAEPGAVVAIADRPLRVDMSEDTSSSP